MNKQKCICTNQKNEPCPWTSLPNKLYCKRHLLYDDIYDEIQIKNIKRCSTCKMYMMPADNNTEYKICSKCRERSKNNNIKIKENTVINICKGKTQKGIDCCNQALENDNYCELHQSYKKYITLLNENKIICVNWIRGCWTETNNDFKKCQECRNKENIKEKQLREIKKNNAETYNNQVNNKVNNQINNQENNQINNQENNIINKENNIINKENNIINIENNMCIKCNNIANIKDIKNNKCIICYEKDYNTNKNRNERSVIDCKYTEYKSSAKKRDIIFEITKEQCIELFTKKCFYCGELKNINGIDRLCSNIGYIETNIVPCCEMCNFMKHVKDKETFIKLCEHIVTYNNLYKGNIYEDILENTKFGSYTEYNKSAEKRNLKFEITKEEFINIISQKCNYCGVSGLCNRYNVYGAGGIDRINSNKGYKLNNCVPCCGQCNIMKHDYTKQDFLNKCLQIIQEQKKEIKQGNKNIIENKIIEIVNNKDNIEDELKEDLYKILNGKIKLIKETFLHSKEYYQNRIWNGTIEDVKNIKINLELVNTSELRDIWDYYRKSVSSLIKHHDSQNIGRRFELLVKDDVTNKYLGILCLSSDYMNLEARDTFIGWSSKQKVEDKKINYLMNISTCVPLQPFGFNFNGGKLLTKLVFSQEVQDIFKSRYNHELLAITTTSLYGKSIQYDRLKEIKFVGFTKGNSVYKYPNEFIHKCQDYLKSKHNINILNKNKLYIISSVLQKLDLPKDEFMKDNPKGIYFGFVYPESKDFLTNKKNIITIPKLKSINEIFTDWINRWAEQRYNHLLKNNLIKEYIINKSADRTKKYYDKIKNTLGIEEYRKLNREKAQRFRDNKKKNIIL